MVHVQLGWGWRKISLRCLSRVVQNKEQSGSMLGVLIILGSQFPNFCRSFVLVISLDVYPIKCCTLPWRIPYIPYHDAYPTMTHTLPWDIPTQRHPAASTITVHHDVGWKLAVYVFIGTEMCGYVEIQNVTVIKTFVSEKFVKVCSFFMVSVKLVGNVSVDQNDENKQNTIFKVPLWLS